MGNEKGTLESLLGLLEATSGYLRITDMDQLCQLTADSIILHSSFQRCVVSVIEIDNTFRRAAFAGITPAEMDELRTMPRRTLEDTRHQLVDDFLIGRSYYIPHDRSQMEGLKSRRTYDENAEWHPDDFLFIPLFNPDGAIVGLINVDDPSDGKRPTISTLLPLELFANQMAAALENIRNHQKQTALIQRLRDQQNVVMELSTPVIQIADGILALPLIGAVDSVRAQQVTENILQRITETESTVVIIDITGVPIIDTLVASHLIKTVAASRLLGTETIISGINPEIAQTLIHLGVDLSKILTKSKLSRAIEAALRMTNRTIAPLA